MPIAMAFEALDVTLVTFLCAFSPYITAPTAAASTAMASSPAATVL
jgi:hypothetical protein